MLMVGDGIALADAQPEVVALAETAGLPVFECYASEFTMPASHPLNQGALNFVSATVRPVTYTTAPASPSASATW